MSAEQVALDHYQDQQRIANAAAEVAGGAWGQVDPDDIRGSWAAQSPQVTVALAGAQQAAAAQADGYLDAVLVEQGIPTGPAGRVAPGAFAGVASDGRGLQGLVDQPAVGTLAAIGTGHPVDRVMAMGRASLDMIVRTQVADAGRTADQAAMVARPAATGYVRMLVPPSCSRCAILAGRWYRYSAGFQRHPRCDCRHIPSIEANASSLVTNPRAYFDSLSSAEQERIFTAAGARAIRDGADLSQVVNARRGMFTAGGRRLTRESTTRFGVARPGRLMPEEIYRQAGSRGEAIDLLREHGYLRVTSRRSPLPAPAPAPPPASAPPARPVAPQPSVGTVHAQLSIGGSAARQGVTSELARQSSLAPHAAAQLRRVDQDFGSTHSSGALAHFNMDFQEMHLHPDWSQPDSVTHQAARRAQTMGWFTPTGAAQPLQAVVAHEYGHHITTAMFGNMSARAARRLLQTVRDQLSIPVDINVPGTAMTTVMNQLTRAVENHPMVVIRVSGYAATNGYELLAEVWQEYSTRGAQARPHVRAIGEVMRELAEEAAS